MMEKYIICYANEEYRLTQNRFAKSIIDPIHIIKYTDKWLQKTQFYIDNINILQQEKGAGYWLWKPYIILDILNKINDGDCVLYCDSDAVCLSSLEPLFQLAEESNIILFDNAAQINKKWIKRDCYILMNADNSFFYNAPQTMGGLILIKKDVLSVRFINEWLTYSRNPQILTDINSINGDELDGFAEHRHDQSILSILRLKWKLPYFQDPTQYGLIEKKHYTNQLYNVRVGRYGQLITLKERVQKKSLKQLIKRAIHQWIQ